MGYLNLEGRFASQIDKELKMQHKAFFNMNMAYQRKYIKDMAQTMDFKNKTTKTTRSSVTNTTAKFPKLKDLIKDPGMYFWV